MAIQVAYTLPDGIELPEAYAKIKRVTLDMDANIASIEVSVYKDVAAREGKKQPVISFTFYENDRVIKEDDVETEINDFTDNYSPDVLDKSGVNMVKQAYERLKGKTFEGIEFSNGKDV